MILRAAPLLLLAIPASAGLHFSGETFNPLPAKWSGYLTDQRTLRNLANPNAPGGPVPDTYTEALLKLEAAASVGPLTADQAADLGALHVRLGKPEKAVAVLRAAARKHPDHFRLAANLGTAWQLAGDLAQASAALADAVALAPPPMKSDERAHLALVEFRRKNPGAVGWEELYPQAFAAGKPGVGTAPPAAAAALQRLGLWLPNDPKLLWQLAELANATGDVRTAANILDGVATEFGFTPPELLRRRQLYRAAADGPDHEKYKPTLAFAAKKPLARAFDAAKLPDISDGGVTPVPWAVFAEADLGKKRFAPTYLPWLEKLDGKKVAVVGYLRPPTGGFATGNVLLTEFPIGCWFCDAPDATGLIGVALAVTDIPRNAVKVTGILRLNKTDPEAYLFTMDGARVGAAD